MAQNVLVYIPGELKRKYIHSAIVGWSSYPLHPVDCWHWVYSLLIFCWLALSISNRGILKSSTIIVGSPILPCSIFSFSSHILCSVVRWIHLKDCYVFMEIWSFYFYLMPFFIHVIIFHVLNSMLSENLFSCPWFF